MGPPSPSAHRAPVPRRGLGRARLLECFGRETGGTQQARYAPPPYAHSSQPPPHPPADGYEPRKVPQSFILAGERCLPSPGKRARGAAGPGLTPSLGKVAVRSKNLCVPAANGTSPQNHCNALGGQSAGAGAAGPRTMALPHPPPPPRPPSPPTPPSCAKGKGGEAGEGEPLLACAFN